MLLPAHKIIVFILIPNWNRCDRELWAATTIPITRAWSYKAHTHVVKPLATSVTGNHIIIRAWQSTVTVHFNKLPWWFAFCKLFSPWMTWVETCWTSLFQNRLQGGSSAYPDQKWLLANHLPAQHDKRRLWQMGHNQRLLYVLHRNMMNCQPNILNTALQMAVNPHQLFCQLSTESSRWEAVV